MTGLLSASTGVGERGLSRLLCLRRRGVMYNIMLVETPGTCSWYNLTTSRVGERLGATGGYLRLKWDTLGSN
eukprot:scaffold17932_cov58-Phaeocystis_antarctica.AAC.1